MTFFDYYLRGSDESSVSAALARAELSTRMQNEGEVAVSFAPGVSVDWIGALTDAPDEDTEPAPLTGWHANVRLDRELTDDEREALADVLIDPPATPRRVWA
ncbi:hypothetical protein QZM66_22955 [Burkholderia contaminans]|uniref:hypothetical protein n=1 Tax=Burkholderia contaminans TaxID=488447 RepID=UPI00265382A1|nr:hypothetical protein [Burkholderia contaminans]MDN7790427.1 hypothetical protein [Burkholderia contaminans]